MIRPEMHYFTSSFPHSEGGTSIGVVPSTHPETEYD